MKIKYKLPSTKLCKNRWIFFKLVEQVDGFILECVHLFQIFNFKSRKHSRSYQQLQKWAFKEKSALAINGNFGI
jgi:hypothetical protein